MNDVAAEPADRPGLDHRLRHRRLVGRQPEPARERVEARALDQGRGDDDEEDRVEDVARLAADAGDHREGREPDRHGAAEPGPAQHQPLPHARTARTRSRARPRAGGRRRSARAESASASAATSPSSLGNTRRPEEEEQRDLRDPAHPLVERDRRAARGDGAGPQDQRRRCRPTGSPIRARPRRAPNASAGGRERRDGVEARRRQVEAPECRPRARTRPRCPTTRPMRELRPARSTAMSSDAVARALDPVDEPEHEDHRDRVVHARLALERPRQPPAQARAAQHREDRGGVGRGDRRADDQALEELEVEEPARGRARRCTAVAIVPTRRARPPSRAPGGSPASRRRARPRTGSGRGRSSPASGSAPRRRTRRRRSPSEPASIPRPRNSSRPGTRTRSATFAATRPAAISRPATRISSASLVIIDGYPASSAAASCASISSGESGPMPSPGRVR